MILTSEKTFEEVLKQDDEVVVMFSTAGCGPCSKMKREVLPELERDGIDVLIVDAMEHPEALNGLNITSVPFTVLYENGEIRKTRTGYMSTGDFRRFLD